MDLTIILHHEVSTTGLAARAEAEGGHLPPLTLPKKPFIYVGPEGSRSFGSFHFKPKAHADEEEVSEDE